MRKAKTTIPLQLGNLRQEIEEERALLRYRCRENDRYDVFPSLRKRTRKQRAVVQLLQSTIEKMWQEFKNVERPFSHQKSTPSGGGAAGRLLGRKRLGREASCKTESGARPYRYG